MIDGNIIGVKDSILNELESLIKGYNRREFVDSLVLECICKYSALLNREISVFISRSGLLLNVVIGDYNSAPIKTANGKRQGKLSGIRCLHTHPSGDETLSNMDLSALLRLKLDSISAVSVIDSKPGKIQTAFIDGDGCKIINCSSKNIPNDVLLEEILVAEKSIKSNNSTKEGEKLAITCNFTTSKYLEEELVELNSLCKTAGLTVVGSVTQLVDKPNKATYMGSGKVGELARLVQIKNAEYVIINNELTGSQINNLEQRLGVKILDRPMLILEIFAMHATTNEGKLQVELARLKYTLPKLLGQGQSMSRIGGGGKTKGSGETKLETDRRHIREVIYDLNKKIKKLEQDRANRRKKRINSSIKSVAIVGYTNAGKSTLMNRLTKAGVLEENKLFATLDPVTRKIFVDVGKEYLLTDTVGFIDNLPHEFIEAFKSTLEEAVCADLLLHVVDASSTDTARQIDVVNNVLNSLGIENKPTLLVYNKVDESRLEIPNGAVGVSAKTGEGIEQLKNRINEIVFGDNM